MALRKAKTKEQMEAALQPMLDPGERVVAAGLCEGGPSRWWMLISIYLVIFVIKVYYVAVTDRRVIFMKVSTWTGRPKGLLRAEPRNAAAVTEVNPHPVWSTFVYRLPEGSTKKLRFHRIWRDEMTALLQALRAPAPTAPGGFAE